MTIIVGIEYDGGAFLGSDASISSEDYISSISGTKLITKKRLIFAYTGHFRPAQVIEKIWKPPEYSGVKTDEYLYKRLIPSLQAVFEKHKVTERGSFLLGFRKKIYVIQDDFAIVRTSKSYYAEGTGESYALGSFHSTEGLGIDPSLRAVLALEAACEFSPSCQGPIYVEKVP